jgi:hypothetical protein
MISRVPMRGRPAPSRSVTVTVTLTRRSLLTSRYFFFERRTRVLAVTRAGIANLTEPSLTTRLDARLRPPARLRLRETLTFLAVVRVSTPAQSLLPAQLRVTGATRRLDTLIARLAIRTKEVAALTGAAEAVTGEPWLAAGVGSAGAPGAVVSTVNVTVAGDASKLPAASVARTSNVCAPSLSGGDVKGVGHGAKPWASNWHANVAFGSSDENVNVGVGLLVGLDGPESIVVSGAVMSTVNDLSSGVRSIFPAASLA